MSKKDLIVGLDIGTTKVSCIVGELVDSGTRLDIDIIGIGTAPSCGLRKGVVVNIDSTVESIRKAVEEAELMAGAEIKEVYAGIGGGHIKSMNSTGIVAVKDKEVSPQDVRRVIEAAKAVAIPTDREVIHVIPQEFMIDSQDGIREPVGMSGVRLESKVHIITGANSATQNVIKCANKAGLNVREICLNSIASSESVLLADEKELGVVLVDIGGGTTDIAIFKEGAVVHTSVIGVGGGHITNDIALGLRTPQIEAERIKVRHGSAMAALVNAEETLEVPGVGGRKPRVLSKKLVAEIIEPRVEEILLLVQNEIVKSGFQDLLSGGVVLTGGATDLDNIIELGEMVFEMPVKRGVPQGVGGLIDIVNSAKHSTSVGILRYAARNISKSKYPARERHIYEKVRGSMVGWFKDLF